MLLLFEKKTCSCALTCLSRKMPVCLPVWHHCAYGWSCHGKVLECKKIKNTRNYEKTGMPRFSIGENATMEAEETLTAFSSLWNPLFESIFDICLFFLLELRCGLLDTEDWHEGPRWPQCISVCSVSYFNPDFSILFIDSQYSSYHQKLKEDQNVNPVVTLLNMLVECGVPVARETLLS